MNTWFRSAFFAVAAFAVLGLASQALAQSVCEGQMGAPFGLCTAYCEAMDCDSGTPQASGMACAKVLAKWDQLAIGSIPCDLAPSEPAGFAERPLPPDHLEITAPRPGRTAFSSSTIPRIPMRHPPNALVQMLTRKPVSTHWEQTSASKRARI